MAITKRTRFEVLRRDEHTCQYCGAKAPDVVLHIDHVIPVSLGGDDKPGNLVTACKDCNTGKSSIAPDAPIVAGLSERAAAYALGMADKMARVRDSFERAHEFTSQFDREWNKWTAPDGNPVPLPPDYEASLYRWVMMGVPFEALRLAIPKAMTKYGLRGEFPEFQYMAGIVWRMIDAHEIDYSVTEATARVFTKWECEDFAAQQGADYYSEGMADGVELERRGALDRDILMHHIDGTTTGWIDKLARVA